MRWIVQISDAADRDIDNIIDWTRNRFGADQASGYNDLIADTIDRLREGPNVAGSKLRSDIDPTFRTLRVGGRGRYLIVYRARSDKGPVIEILPILHDAMDVPRHIRRDL